MASKLSGGAARGKYDVHQNADINVTPFVDVMLVLLIIFMVSAPLATVSIKLDLPPPSNTPIKIKKLPTIVNIQKSGAIFVDQKETTLPELDNDLRAAFQVPRPTDETVLLRSDKEVKYSSFMQVVNQLQTNGYFKVALILEDRL